MILMNLENSNTFIVRIDDDLSLLRIWNSKKSFDVFDPISLHIEIDDYIKAHNLKNVLIQYEYRQTKIYWEYNQNVFPPTLDSYYLINYCLNNNEEYDTMIDFGAGTGVIGIVLNKLLKSNNLFLVEKNSNAKSIIDQNIRNNFNRCLNIQIKQNINEINIEKKMSRVLVLANPPYFDDRFVIKKMNKENVSSAIIFFKELNSFIKNNEGV